MAKIRTIQKIVDEIRAEDPDTAITIYTLRRAIKDGKLPYRKAGTRFLLDYDVVMAYYNTGQLGGDDNA